MSIEVKETGSVWDSAVKTVSAVKPCVIRGMVAPGVAEVGFLQLRASMSEKSAWDSEKKLACSEWRGVVPIVDAARTLPICCDAPAMRVCNRLWQNALAPLRVAKQWVMLRCSWSVELQLEVAKLIATAARKVVVDHSTIFLLCGFAAGGCWMQYNSCAKRRIGLQEAAGR